MRTTICMSLLATTSVLALQGPENVVKRSQPEQSVPSDAAWLSFVDLRDPSPLTRRGEAIIAPAEASQAIPAATLQMQNREQAVEASNMITQPYHRRSDASQATQGIVLPLSIQSDAGMQQKRNDMPQAAQGSQLFDITAVILPRATDVGFAQPAPQGGPAPTRREVEATGCSHVRRQEPSKGINYWIMMGEESDKEQDNHNDDDGSDDAKDSGASLTAATSFAMALILLVAAGLM